MKKITQLSTAKARWLNYQTWVILLGLFLTVFQIQSQTFPYTGSVQSVTLVPGTYNIQMWGADGGDSSNGTGGKGGYSFGTLVISSSTTYYIYVGGKGTGANTATPGGWNGGGSLTGTFSSSNSGATGGGGTDIRTTQNTNYLDRIMVAGGGGGATGYGSYSGNGGNGGGTVGEDGGSSRGTSYIGSGGTQTAGGAQSSSTYATAGSLGIGGDYTGTLGGSAGGGGYYGGGGGHWGGAGGGGSAYVGGVTSGGTIIHGQSGFIPNPDPTGNGTVVITAMIPCTGTPTAGTASATLRNCINDPFTLSVIGASAAANITYQWQQSPQGAGTWTDIAGATSTAYMITNQSASTDYRFVVVCTNSNMSDTSNVVTVSQAAPQTLYENFDTTSVGSSSNATYPNCWSYIDDVTSTGYGYTIASDPLSSPHTFRLYRTNSTTNSTQELVLISPETDNLGNGTKQLRFYMRSYSTTNYDNKLEILSMPSATSTAGATILATVTNTTATGQNWQEYIVPIPATTNDYFGFRLAYNGNTTASSVILDDIYLEDLETCFHPINITVSNKTSTGADISWNPSPLSTGGTGYEYEIRTSGAPGSGTTGLAATGTTTSLSVTVTGLTPNTDYEVYVRGLCGTATSRWNVVAIPFKTLCVSFGNFYENFDSLTAGSSSNPSISDCWSYFDDLVSTGYGYTDDSNSQSGSNSFRFYRTNSTSNAAENVILISPPTDNLGNGGKQVRFSARSQSSSTTYMNSKIDIVTLSNNNGTGTVTVLDSFIINTGTVYQEYTVQLPVTTDDFFGFRLSHNGTTNTSYVYIDDVYYEDTPPMTLTASYTDVLCNGDATGTATVAVTNGVLPLTYSWSPSGGTTDTATGLTAGTYTVTVTDAINRSETATVTLTEPSAIVSNLISTGITCNGANDGSITIAPGGGVAPYTVLWSTNDTGMSISGLTPGTYSVTIFDNNGCSITEDVIISEPAVLAATGSHTDVTLYNGTDGSATVTPSGGTAPYTYAWSPSGGTAATASNLTAGTYTVLVTDANGCTTMQSFTIEQPIPLMVDTFSHTNVSCYGGNNGTATVNVIGGNAPYTYLWSPSGGTSPSATGLTAGTYILEITDSTNNVLTHTVVITEPAAIVGTVSNKTDVQCSSTATGSATITVTGGIAPFTYTWSHGVTTGNATLNNLNAGIYNVTITDANGCSASAPVSVTIGQPAAIVVSNVNTTHVSCFGQNNGSLTVSASGGVAPYTYTWSNGQSGATISNLTHGTYTVTVKDANNCTKSESFAITQPGFLNPPAAANQSFCSGQNAMLSDLIISGNNIKWYSAQSGGMLLPATTLLTNGTTYYASQSDGACESTRTAVQVTLYTATPLATTQLNVCSNTRIQNVSIDGFNYTQLKWYDNATVTTPLVASQLLTTKTYYVSSVTGTCEAPRQAVQVTVAATVPAPSASFQTVCGGTTLADLTVTKDPLATLNWYSSLQSLIPLAQSTVAASGTYYVQQVIGNCESVKIAVQVQVTNVTVPTVSAINTCEGITIADYNVQNGTGYVWFTDNTTTTALPGSYVITSGSYYIANEMMGCLSTRRNIAVNVSVIPASPTGQLIQSFAQGATVGDLQMNEPNVTWFSTYSDAVAQTNALPRTTLLKDQTTYYGIIIGGNNCADAPTAVQVKITVGLPALDLAQLKYYPNPADSELNISYIEAIKKVEVFSITGQKVIANDFSTNTVKVNLSALSSGTYMVRIETETASQFIKIVKK